MSSTQPADREMVHATHPHHEAGSDRKKMLQARLAGCLILVALAVVGLAIVDFDLKDAKWFFVCVVAPIFGLIGFWSQSRSLGSWEWRKLRSQAMHWLGFLVALNVMFLLIRQGQLDRNSGGLMATILLALTAYLAGVHFDWMFMVAGILIAAAAVAASYVEEYMWIILIILTLLIGALLVSRKMHRPLAEK